jgi:hypothetical protein
VVGALRALGRQTFGKLADVSKDAGNATGQLAPLVEVALLIHHTARHIKRWSGTVPLVEVRAARSDRRSNEVVQRWGANPPAGSRSRSTRGSPPSGRSSPAWWRRRTRPRRRSTRCHALQAAPVSVDLVFKLSYGNMLYMGKSGHFTQKWPNFP